MKLFHIHRVYEVKRAGLQQRASKKPSLRRVLAKYSRRERNRSRDFIHKQTTFIAREFDGFVLGSMGLRRERMFNGSKNQKLIPTLSVQ
jgi:putative transposase